MPVSVKQDWLILYFFWETELVWLALLAVVMMISHPYKDKIIILSRSDLWRMSHDCVVNKNPTVHLINICEALKN